MHFRKVICHFFHQLEIASLENRAPAGGHLADNLLRFFGLNLDYPAAAIHPAQILNIVHQIQETINILINCFKVLSLLIRHFATEAFLKKVGKFL